MERARFDAIARALARRADRRVVLAAALGLAAGPVAAGATPSVRCRTIGATCRRGPQCCSGFCPTGRSVPIRERNRCGCGGHLVACGRSRSCVNVLTDPNHCGDCDTVCRGYSSCEKGECVAQACGDTICPMVDGMACCNDECHNLLDDPAHCGECGVACGDGEACRQGVCTIVRACDDIVCPMVAGMECCDGACRDLQTDDAHCGSCNRACGPSSACIGGVCRHGGI